MTWSAFDVDQLDEFVGACDQAGGVHALYGGSAPSSVDMKYRTSVDVALDPFSEEYVGQQIALYEEISGRKLNQMEGEGADIWSDEKVYAANPYNSQDSRFIAKHCRAILSGLVSANLPDNAAVLDMGSGWGISSEMMAYCGTRVTSVDINPQFVRLNKMRAERIGLPIAPIHSSFDSFETDEKFDMVLFYECFHHAVRPWIVIEKIVKFLKPGGKIVLVGEPYVEFFPHWGMRIEPLSLYCIRKYGWFESGWTVDFIRTVFDRCGLDVFIAPTIGLDNGVVLIASKKGEPPSHDFGIAAPYMHLAQSFEDLSKRHIALATSYNDILTRCNALEDRLHRQPGD